MNFIWKAASLMSPSNWTNVFGRNHGKSTSKRLDQLTCKQRVLFALLFAAILVVYFTSMPSASWNYQYTPAAQIAESMVTAPIDTGIQLARCPLIPKFAVSSVEVDLDPDEASLKELSSGSKVVEEESRVLVGGAWRPINCTSRHRVSVVVPYRNRPRQLKIFLNHMHRFLRRQFLDYRIVIVQQNDTHPFNRAALLNVGYLESLKLYDFHCFIFHDVDLLPEVLANMYACSTSPRHMTVAINTMRYNLPYEGIFGGVTAMTADQFRLVDGYSNYFFGWGGEDDDLSNRIAEKGMKPMRWDPKISRYYMMSHAKEPPNPNRFTLLQSGHQRYGHDGLSSLMYTRVKVEELELYTLVSVQFDHLNKIN